MLSRICGNGIRLTRTRLQFQPSIVTFRDYSNPAPKRGFLNNLIDNVRDEMQKNKELQEHQQQLKARMQELNESDALKDARKKFEIVEKETLKSSEVVKQKIEELSDHMKKMVHEIQKTEAGKKMTEAGAEALKQARKAAEHVEKVAEKVGDTEVYKHVSTSMKTVKDEIDNIADVRMYSRPEALTKRTDGFDLEKERVVEANDSATDVTLHKDSKWYSGWKNFSESNTYYHKLLDWKIKYDESDNMAVRMMRGVTEKIGSVFSGQNEVSEVLTEIHKIDANFDKQEWLRFCETKIIPNILEAFIRFDLEVLQSWCHERAYTQLSTVVKEYQKMHFSTKDSRIIDINKVEMATGKMMEQGPVLIISFQVYMINVTKNADGKVVEGDPDNPKRINHIWVLCRDVEEYNPALAWKLLEVHMQETPLAL
ncbi:putative mitochondrial import inner membrane translocase subunit tin-44 [Caenorhabditis elegans]|uniref:Probable mitochondrial import inner membrane translocase subunit tin-44 n=1 Tax=Caenorhabditis elegans TaxID=6239 RepID=TIM44_CAEEL|nr:putative mitochondrial import inner membrane translocase subunit tin-44 [Caenorhabditis elegans]O02161.1 RecName: Full=Probable mitochondrial import inner membrane translocase subunit tin-44; Flags: Precursor [Caenorhabditis elegans]CCD71993.1 Probable mitochondrial import inner membrane translocase subunit tin-44 [Caenorhabditis elegans]|eukprot:NP_491780.1 Probable mitochondrial import inner membrane translocase subunit tin-44 [Caenorhabditis elegans]